MENWSEVNCSINQYVLVVINKNILNRQTDTSLDNRNGEDEENIYKDLNATARENNTISKTKKS